MLVGSKLLFVNQRLSFQIKLSENREKVTFSRSDSEDKPDITCTVNVKYLLSILFRVARIAEFVANVKTSWLNNVKAKSISEYIKIRLQNGITEYNGLFSENADRERRERYELWSKRMKLVYENAFYDVNTSEDESDDESEEDLW